MERIIYLNKSGKLVTELKHLPHVQFLVATTRIAKGAEVFHPYGSEYFSRFDKSYQIINLESKASYLRLLKKNTIAEIFHSNFFMLLLIILLFFGMSNGTKKKKDYHKVTNT
jgi:hypothetical protein